MNIVGGMALPNRVNISSENFSVVATAGANGKITHTTTAVSAGEKWLHDVTLMPKVIKMFLFVLMKLTPRGRMIALAIIVGIPLLLPYLVSPEQVTGFAGSKYKEWFTIGIRVVTFTLVAHMLLSVRGFHGAEHMAIAAYEKHGVEGLDQIAQQDRVHNKCGGRMALPTVLAFGGSQLVTAFISAPWVAFLPLFLLEVVLWIDALIGYDKIPLTQNFSAWFQRTITTKPPNDIELNTGRHALRQLLIAEGELMTNESTT